MDFKKRKERKNGEQNVVSHQQRRMENSWNDDDQHDVRIVV